VIHSVGEVFEGAFKGQWCAGGLASWLAGAMRCRIDHAADRRAEEPAETTPD
jgi:hypothetical protein